MDSSAIAWTAMILVVVFLTLTFAPNWSLAILILVGKIAQAFDGKKTAKHTANGHSGSGSGPDSDSGSGPGPRPSLGHHHQDRQDNATDVYLEMKRLGATADAAAGEERKQLESSSTTSTSSGTVFEVFLNFHGPDTRATITSYLHNTLVKAGISVFLDDEELHYGEIQPQLIKAIQQSKVSIVIFSTDYASNRFRLMELVQMWGCSKTNGQTIIPIFYNVSPSDVRKQEGDFGRAFSLHEKIVDSKTIEKWREVLRDIGDLPGHSGKLYEGYENQLVEEVVLRVARILRDDGLPVTDKLVGIDLHVQEMMRKLGITPSEGGETEVHREDVGIIGIYGEPGVGKTTLAKVIYNEVHTLFEAYSFLEGISAKGVQVSQQLLIADLLHLEPAPLESVDEGTKKIASLFRNKKVLIVLDDVDEDEQIKALAGTPTWFGSGSRIIVTMNNKKVLSAFDVGEDDRRTIKEHEIKPMSDDHALRLFRYHAFEGNAPEEISEYDSLSKDIVKAIGGVPKDIVHHASNLGRNMSIDSWRSTLELLQERGRTGRLSKSVMQDAPAFAVDASAPAGKPESTSTTSSSSGIEDEVFLSFRGLDTRTTIVSCLYKTLKDAGISVFRDYEEILIRERIELGLPRTIKESRISIAILSINYASSQWCLRELVQMWDCRKTNGQTIIPIFYNVSASDVREQEGDFGKAFRLLEKNVDSKTIQKWREVLRDIGDLPGHSGKLYEGHDGQLAEEVVLRVARILRDDGLAVTDKLFGIDQEMMRKLGVDPREGRETEVRGEDVRVIGICGVPGVGKTTRAKIIYNEVHKSFEACSFLEGISLKGVKLSLRMLIADLLNLEFASLESVDEGIKKIATLFKNKKVLIVLDDVDGDEQIKALAGKLTWFGSGSRIIVTTRNGNVLSAFDIGANGGEIVEEHEIEPMSDDHALQLFRYHAFQGNAPEEVCENDSLSKDIVKAIGGVPKDIVHHASNLGCNMSIDSWRSTLELLQERGRTGGLPKSVVQEDRSLEIPLKTSKRIITEDMD